ncbi:hypothetical protein GP486_003259 [Trichoglossum hirsutum]|uniref:Uncharacterized protein n=1 Tax=Trichoglossum hirsutum TaxID=265104 RepID=A0A9P8LDE2_9PEZI|nr:hypothetical protein GP486_003259 [Trichoglossum hirsutum]
MRTCTVYFVLATCAVLAAQAAPTPNGNVLGVRASVELAGDSVDLVDEAFRIDSVGLQERASVGVTGVDPAINADDLDVLGLRVLG